MKYPLSIQEEKTIAAFLFVFGETNLPRTIFMNFRRYKAELQDDNNASFTTRSVHSGVTFPEDSKEDRKRTSSYELQSRPMHGNPRPESRTSGDYDYPDPQPTGTRESFPYYDNPGLQKDHTQ